MAGREGGGPRPPAPLPLDPARAGRAISQTIGRLLGEVMSTQPLPTAPFHRTWSEDYLATLREGGGARGSRWSPPPQWTLREKPLWEDGWWTTAP